MSRTFTRARAAPGYAYSTPGDYVTGVWLIAQRNGTKAQFVDRAHLPPVGRGWQYYWLGSSWKQANSTPGFGSDSRINDALAKLGVTMDSANAYQQAQKAFHDAASGRPDPRLPGSGNVTGGGAGDPGSAVAAAEGTFKSVSDAINSTSDFLKFIAWIFHPRNILRAVEFLVGLVLMGFGLQAAMQARGEGIEGFTTSEGVLTRSGLGRVATELGRATRGSGTARHPKPRKPQRPRSAPHRTRQRALKNRYLREETRYRNRAN